MTKQDKINKLAKSLDLNVITDRPTNGYGGTSNGEQVIWYDKETDKTRLVCTCGNCGDGSWTIIDDLLKLIK